MQQLPVKSVSPSSKWLNLKEVLETPNLQLVSEVGGLLWRIVYPLNMIVGSNLYSLANSRDMHLEQRMEDFNMDFT